MGSRARDANPLAFEELEFDELADVAVKPYLPTPSRDEIVPRFTLQLCHGGEALDEDDAKVLRDYKTLCDALLPGLRYRSHLYKLLHSDPSVVLREHDDVIGGATFRLVRCSAPGLRPRAKSLLIMDVVALAVDQQPGVCGQGFGTRIVNYMKALLAATAAADSDCAGGIMITQADEGGAARQFWARQRLRATPQAVRLLRAMHVARAREANHVVYLHVIPMILCLPPQAQAARKLQCAPSASARAQYGAVARASPGGPRHTRHTPHVRVKLKGALTLLPPIEKPREASSSRRGEVSAPAGRKQSAAALARAAAAAAEAEERAFAARCASCGEGGGELFECHVCGRAYHYGACAGAPAKVAKAEATRVRARAAERASEASAASAALGVLRETEWQRCYACDEHVAGHGLPAAQAKMLELLERLVGAFDASPASNAPLGPPGMLQPSPERASAVAEVKPPAPKRHRI